MKKGFRVSWGDIFFIVIFIIILAVPALRLSVVSNLQRALLYTGIFNANTSYEKSENQINYQFLLTDTANSEIEAKAFKNKVLFVNVWATWCPPCLAEMPEIAKLHQDVGHKVEFIMISLDQDQQKAKRWISENDFAVPVYFPVRLSSDLRYDAIPSTWVVGRNGEIVYHRSGMAQYNTTDFKNFLLSQ